MTLLPWSRTVYRKLALVCETALLVGTTLMLISIYVYPAKDGRTGWLVTWAFLILLAFVGSVVFEYFHQRVIRLFAEEARYHLHTQLVETLKTMKVPKDVVKCLRRLSSSNQGKVMSEAELLLLLEENLGKRRSSEVSEVVMKYAMTDRVLSPHPQP